MGASCAKGSKTNDPDKTPYAPSAEVEKNTTKRTKEEEEKDAMTVEDSGGDGDRLTSKHQRKQQANLGREEEEKESQRQAGLKSDTSKPRRTSHEADSTRGSPTKTSISDAPQSAEKKRQSRERQDSVPEQEDDKTADQPRPKKRRSKEEKTPPKAKAPSPEDTPEENVWRPAEKEEGRQSSKDKSAIKFPQDYGERVKHTADAHAERKRSSLDNEFVVPVELETKGGASSSSRLQASPAKNLMKSDQDPKTEVRPRSGRGDERKIPSDEVKESDIEVRLEESRKFGKDQRPGTSPTKAYEVGDNTVQSNGLDSSPVGQSVQMRSIKRDEKPAHLKLDEPSSPKRKSGNLETVTTPTRIPINAQSGISPPRGAGLASTQKQTSEASYPPGYTSALQPAVKMNNESRKSPPKTVSVSNDVSAEPPMAIFGALKGLKSPKATSGEQQNAASMPQEVAESSKQSVNGCIIPVSPISLVGESPQSSASLRTPAAATQTSISSTNQLVSSDISASAAATTDRLSDATNDDSRKPVPTLRTTLLQQKQPTAAEPVNAAETKKVSNDGIDSSLNVVNDDVTKSRQERVSKLPIKGSLSGPSPVSSPSGTSASQVASPISASQSPASPPTPTVSDSKPTEKVLDKQRSIESSASKSDAEMHEMKSQLPDLSQDNKALIDAYPLCSSTRTKLLLAIDRWLSGSEKEKENASRVMAISGKPGIGKTCLAAEVCRRYSNQLAGVHFFQFLPKRLDHNYLKTMLLSIVAKLTAIIPGYCTFLPTPDELRQMLMVDDYSELFDALISRPLQNPGLCHDPEKHLLVVLDAVDECHLADRNRLLELLNNFERKTPDWFYLFFTIADDNQLTGQLDRIHIIELKGTSEVMTADIKRYLRDPMARLIDRISLDGALTQLVTHAQGTFLAAYLLRRKLESYPDGTALALRDVAVFPTGLADIYKEAFQRLYDHLSKKFSAKETPHIYSGVVGVLATAREKLDKAFVKQIHSSLDADEILSSIKGLLDIDGEQLIGFHHRSTSEWLTSDQAGHPLSINVTNARQKMAEIVLVWLTSVLDDSSEEDPETVSTQLRQYALKHVLEHLTDVQKQQENIANILCSLNFLKEKLSVPGVTISDILHDYNHSHFQVTGSTSKLITLEGYMKRSVNLTEQIEAYHGFVQSKSEQISRDPKFLLQVAANYPTVPRIQQNARLDLAENPWIEDLTAVAETPSLSKTVVGKICHSDVSIDGRTAAILTQDKQQVFLYLLNLVSGEFTGEPLDLSSIAERRGLCVKFLPDNNNLFVGSLTTFIGFKNGKPVPSGLDIQSIQVKERFSVECCDAANNLLVCGINTLPWGGRSLHMIVFDQKTKAAKTLEVLKFRFGGSAHFGIKACSLSSDGSLLGACVKQTNKFELKATIWSTGSWTVLHTVDVENDTLTRCFFAGNLSLILSGSTGVQQSHQKSYLWAFKENPSKPVTLGNPEHCSIVYAKNSLVTAVQRSSLSTQVTVTRWKDSVKLESPDDRYIIHGIDALSDMIATDKCIIYLVRNLIRLYKVADLMDLNRHSKLGSSFALYDVIVDGLGFIPRSDDPIVVHRSNSSTMATGHPDGHSGQVTSASRLNLKNDGGLSSTALFTNETVVQREKLTETARCFIGTGSTFEICSFTSDGSMIVVNTGNDVKLLDVATGNRRLLPRFAEIKTDPSTVKQSTLPVSILTCVLSTKESLAGIIYPEKPESLFLFDLKSKTITGPTLEIHLDAVPITDFTFIPSNGYVISYHRNSEQALVVWNQRNGTPINKQTHLDVVYARSSPSTDRLAMSLRSPGRSAGGTLVLRNSDSHFNINLEFTSDASWDPEVGRSDVEFSGDGTILLGMVVKTKSFRIWNAANGEALKDLDFQFIRPTTEIVGMITNAHALLKDESMLYVCDVASGELVTALYSNRLWRKGTSRGVRISPKGSLIVGSSEGGAELRIFQCHNLSEFKRKMSLHLFRNK